MAFKEARRKELIKGVHIEDSDEDVSLLQYADDAILTGSWDAGNAKNMVRILKCFQICSGLKVNLKKSSIMGVGVNKEDIDRLAQWLNCKSSSIPFNNLGLPVGGKMTKVTSWQPIIDKFNMRLSRWKARQLSIGGRLCLSKAVLGSLGTYFFPLYKAPKKVLKTLECICRRFFFGR